MASYEKKARADAAKAADAWLLRNPAWESATPAQRVLLHGLAHETSLILVFGARNLERGANLSRIGYAWHGVQGCDFRAHASALRQAGREEMRNSDILPEVREFFKGGDVAKNQAINSIAVF